MEAQACDDAVTSGDGAVIRYRTFGGGGPGVVLLHGGMQTSRNLRTLAALLADRFTVHVIDPAPPGAGQVWRTSQPPELLMNTVASQVTLFTDESVECAGPIRPGPSLYAWEGCEAGPDDYPG